MVGGRRARLRRAALTLGTFTGRFAAQPPLGILMANLPRRPLVTRRCPGQVRMLPGPAPRRSRCTRRPRRQNLRLARPSAPFSRWSSPHLCFDDTLAARLESKRRCSCSLYDGAAHSTSPGRASASRTPSAQTRDLGLSLTSDMLKSTIYCRRMRTRMGRPRG